MDIRSDDTRVLGRPVPPPHQSPTQGPPRAPLQPPRAPGASSSGGLGILWTLIRLGVMAGSLILLAQSVGAFLSTPLAMWLGALGVGLALPAVLYLQIRRMLSKGGGGARLKLNALTWLFGFDLLVSLALWALMPGLATEAVTTQGAFLASGMINAFTPNRAPADAVGFVSGLMSKVTGALETAVFGPEKVKARMDRGRAALAAVTGKPLGGTSPSPADPPVAGAAVPLAGAGEGPVPVPDSPAPGGEGMPDAQATVAGAGSVASPVVSAVPGPPVKSEGPIPLSSAGTGPAPLVAAAAKSVEVPYVQEGGFLFVDVVINRLYPARLLLDNASARTTLDGDSLKRMGISIPSGTPVASLDTDTGAITDVVVVADTLAIGGLEVEGVSIMRCNDCKGLSYVGILGTNVLSNFGFSLDQAAGVVRLEDRRASVDQRADIKPYVTLDAVPQSGNPGAAMPFIINATSKAPREIRTLFARLTLLDQNRQTVGVQEVKLPSLPSGKKVSKAIEVPRQPPFTYFDVELAEARW